VLEGCNSAGQLFGEERLLAVFGQNQQADQLFAEIQLAISEFCGAAQDDVSMVEVTLVDEASLSRPALAFSDCSQFSPLDWSASFEFRAQTLRQFNPLPFLLQLLLEVQELRSQAGALYTVLAELYSNALEHGVLGLDSRLKCDASGFSRYYSERNEQLANLDQGFVRFHLQLTPEAGGGRLTLRVEDSGAGFDPHAVPAPQAGGVVLCGRGMALVRQLTESCSYSADGRSVSVEFLWAATK
jgi:two-component system, HptB-dependent secretion and biofilm response regulator